MITKINFSTLKDIIAENFESISQENPSLKFELSAAGELIIMSPTGGETGNQNANLVGLFFVWNEQHQQGFLFDSSTCFKLPNGADRSPDVAWVNKQRWLALTPQQRKKFPPLAPDFVLELLSPTDNLKDTQEKMEEYLSAGVRLGWLLNTENKVVEIYRFGLEKEVKQNPLTISGEDVLPGLVINLNRIWGD